MLPTKGQKVAATLVRSLKSSSRCFSAVPLTESLDDEPRGQRKANVESDVKITTLSNGIKVASVDTGASISRISIAANVGSRHESVSNLGINHLLKNTSFMDNAERTSLRTVREIQEVGGALEVSGSREINSKTAVFLRDRLPEVLENVAPGITKPLYQSWEVTDARNLSHDQNVTVNGDDAALNVEYLHKAAYRNGLGNSLYCDNLNLGSYSSSEIAEFASNNFVGNKMTIAGTDVNHDELVRYIKELFGGLSAGEQQSTPQQKYFGGDIRKHTSNELTHVSLVTEGVSMFNGDLASYIVLQRLLGVGPYTKWGDNTQSSRLTRAGKGAVNGPLSINALNISYSDSGLFGINAVSTPGNITSVLKAAVNEISNLSRGQVSAEELNRAKTQSKATILMLGESKADLLDDMVKQVAFKNAYITPQQAVGQIEKVTVDSVAKAAKKLLSTKSTMSVTGNVASAPYADELL